MAETNEQSPGQQVEESSVNVKSNVETYFETTFFNLRFILLIPVLASLFGSTIMFALGSYNVYSATASFFLENSMSSKDVILPIIKALDAFLIGIILIIFSFGIYDFFISKLDPADHASIRPDWFKFESTGELKNKLIEVVLVILSIKFFEQVLVVADDFQDPYINLIIPTGAAILAISLGFFKWATEH
ncbi:YqhA family protein [Halobellus sp. GM3]|uniref:YqhA family protein n=1 Tax=Halobellus sp. GM3 TaxID=3458410 RepID=UPI00403E1868